jgi:putative DNA primase/helicase
MTAISYTALANLTGRIGLRDVPCPLCGPGRREPANRKRKVLRVWHKEPGFATYMCARCGATGFAHDETKPRRSSVAAEAKAPSTIAPPEIEAASDDVNERFERAKRLWRKSVPLSGTLGHRYFTEHRKLNELGDLSHALRWHQGINAVIAKMTDAVTNKATGIHRTFLDERGIKIDRKMLGKQGTIRLSPDDEVTMGLGIVEGVEDGLSVLQNGWRPVWVATSAGAISRFPVLNGIECLTVFADSDAAGMNTAQSCVDRWIDAGREAEILPANEFTQKGG